MHRLTLSMLLLAGAWHLAGQSKKPEDLAAGKILVTTRGAADPHFAKSVILLVRFDQTGALGLMVNRRTTMPISEALRDVDGAGSHSEPVFVGGPVELDSVFALTRGPRKPEGAMQATGDISFIATKPALQKMLAGTADPSVFRIYLGYCGWGPRQLENEARYGLWYIFNGGDDVVFDGQPATLWSRLIAKAEAELARVRNR